MSIGGRSFWFVALPLVAALASCARARGCAGCDDEAEEEEERALARDHFWRAQVRIRGEGRVHTFVPAFDCTSGGEGGRGAGECGPKLVRFRELAPPTMEAVAAPGWAFDHWESETLEPDGAVRPRAGPMPDGRVYLNGFGYADTGELETVTAVFTPAADGG